MLTTASCLWCLTTCKVAQFDILLLLLLLLLLLRPQVDCGCVC
jgi:hypothetical protein